MPIETMSFIGVEGCKPNTAKHILFVSNNSHVARIHASPISAEMVYNLSNRNLSYSSFVDNPVSHFVVMATEINYSIPFASFNSSPFDTSGVSMILFLHSHIPYGVLPTPLSVL